MKARCASALIRATSPSSSGLRLPEKPVPSIPSTTMSGPPRSQTEASAYTSHGVLRYFSGQPAAGANATPQRRASRTCCPVTPR